MGGKRICLACRTLLDAGESCEGKKHRTVDLSTERAQVDDAVWGPASRERALRNAAKAGAGGGAAGGLAQGCGGCDAGCADIGAGGGEAVVVIVGLLLVVIVFAAVGFLLYWIIQRIIEWRRNIPKPHGALYGPPHPRFRGVRASGTVTTGNAIAIPWKDSSAIAFAFELHEKRAFGGGAMLRECRTGGFDIALDDGRILRVPRGPLRIVSPLTKDDVDAKRLDAYLAEADPTRMDEQSTLFPYDYARAATIEGPGARVAIVSNIQVGADGGATQAYRANAAIWSPVGVPVLRVVKPGSRAEDVYEASVAEADSEAMSMRRPG